MLPRLVCLALAVCSTLQVACKQREADPQTDHLPVDGGTEAPPEPSDAVPTELKPLGLGCSAGAECASGYCVDGVCCESACDQQCASCGLAGSPGYCTGQIVGDDLSAATACTGAKTCSLDFTSPTLASCRLKSGQACTTNAECATANCAPFFEDSDRDGYGGARALHLCVPPGGAAPPGYTSVGGDCCDSDPSAFPGQTAYFTVRDACGSWDYSCDGAIQGFNGEPVTSCGQTVSTGSASGRVTVSCH